MNKKNKKRSKKYLKKKKKKKKKRKPLKIGNLQKKKILLFLFYILQHNTQLKNCSIPNPALKQVSG